MSDERSPVMEVGRYAGKRIDQLPLSYLRWMLTQDFPKELLEHAKKKVQESSFDNTEINVSRHALDMFSLRFLNRWHEERIKDPNLGIATCAARLAQEAWERGKDTSLNRHQNDGYRRVLDGIQWVYDFNQDFPEDKVVITVMGQDE